MKKTKIQRLLALILCLAVVISSFTIVAFGANDNSSLSSGGGVDDSIYDSDDVFESLGMISYDEYLADNVDVPEASGAIVIDAIEQLDKEKSDAAYLICKDGNDLEKTGGIPAILTPPTGDVSWTVTVPEKARYTITIVYYAYVKEGEETKADSVERIFKINGKAPFSEARALTIKKNWINDYPDAIYTGKESLDSVISEGASVGLQGRKEWDESRKKDVAKFEYPDAWTSDIVDFCSKYGIRFMKLDIYNNEIRPSAFQSPVWSEYTITDSMGFYTEAFDFVLEEGENTITLEGKNAYLAISEIILSPAKEVFSYNDYKELYAGQPAGSGSIRIEAEYTDTASDKTIYPAEDSADSLTSPHDPSKTLLNTMGGEKWQTAGQSVTYKFKVDKSGMYDIVFRFKQNVLDGMFVNRMLSLYSDESLKDGELGYYNGVPFEEAKTLTYNFNENWQVTGATDGTTNFEFYFKEGVVYTMKLEVNLGSMADIITTVQDALDDINSDYLSIIQLTGSTPDQYRDYGFSRIMPQVLINMVENAYILNKESDNESEWGVAQKLTALAGEKSSNVGTLQKISDLLLEMGRDEGEIARLLDRLKSYIGTLGTFLSDVKTQPLLLDYISVQGTEEEMPKAKANFWETFVHEVKRFFCSFTRDYDAIGVMTEVQSGEALEVWLATGRDQFQVKRNLVNNDFVSNNASGHDIAVELKLVAAGTLLPSILSGQGPDVYHGLDQGTVINYAIRSAVLEVDSFSDFEQVKSSFNDAATIVLAMDNADGETHYYGLPEAQGFAMMYVRVDILADLGIDIPRTWDDIMAAIPKLQAKNMQIGLTTDSTIHLYQMGGELFADNGMRINLDSQVGLAAFKKTCDLFTKYGFPYTYDAANRFRTGEMPIVIADYIGLYNQLKVFATEIEGSWIMVPVPGVKQEDGTVNNLAISSVNASVIVKGCEERGKKGDAWEYIKWFTGDECQAEYSNEMVALLGPSAKYNTANIHALEKLPWTTEELARIRAQFNNLASVPNYPGRYILVRYTEFAFLAAYNDGMDPQNAIRSYITPINKEITRKRAEFGLETLEQGQTLADKRFDQANAAAAELANRNDASYGYLVKDIDDAVKLKDSAHLKALAADIMAQTEADTSVIISKGPDITTLSEKQLLYYLAEALVDAADALLTY